MQDPHVIRDAFAERFGYHPRLIVRAPGRVNLIGEHTDYNEGFVFPIAIDREAFVAARSRPDTTFRVYTAQFDQEDSFTIDQIERRPDMPWANYVRGVVKGILARDLPITGADLLISSDVPLGSGLSSSASLEVAVGYAVQLLNNINLLGEELALLAQGAENSFVGVQCGIMDQFISALGRADHALLLDCRDLSYRPLPIPPDVRVVVCGSGVHHNLGNSGYNERRAACNEAVRLLRARMPKISALRDVSVASLTANADLLPPTILMRARHVVTENQRTLAAAAALERADLVTFGRLMNESHASMRDDYEVSVPEIDLLTELARAVPGCYGSRLTGGGFGGSTVSMVTISAVDGFVQEVAAGYLAQTGRTADILVCRPSEGVGRATAV
ncbi:galactokinase [Oscillochloris sp. ZM17-4]|uniref:galactokinase n=1 Tax=Oscillochloris sp. ZM17-4 TaxID=2866714 RepID=UPI001C72AD8B|nr:galactokinase [Oscillochloris sp. ZM17-4]MBX0329275.1 galactokinase [Oscillochloris sp. ZM17-4]